MIAIMCAGGLGAVSRAWFDGFVLRHTRGFPWGTMAVNVLGCFLIGVASALPAWRPLGLGFFGGFTTFSTAMLDAVQLARSDRRALALANLLGMAGASFTALLAGGAVARLFA